MKTANFNLFIIVFLFLQNSINTYSQELNFDWVAKIGNSPLHDEANDLAIDQFGNIYITGHFVGTADFDPGPGVRSLTSSGDYDIFILKMDTYGNLIWANKFGGTGQDAGLAIRVDSFGNVYAIGYASGTVDFDPGPGVYNLSGGRYLCKFTTAGNLLWAKNAPISYEDLTIDKHGNIYWVGSFNFTQDFDPGPGTFMLSSVGNIDYAVTKLGASGNFVWAKAMGGTGYDGAKDVFVDSMGNVYSIGFFELTADFDPSITNTFNLTAAGNTDIVVSKLDPNGNFVWAKSIGGSDVDYGYAITADNSGNVYTTGGFKGTADLDPGLNVYNLTAFGSTESSYISQLDAFGNFVWATPVSSTSGAQGHDILLDANNNIYATGISKDPLSSNAFFISKLDNSGNFFWIKYLGGLNGSGNAIKIDSKNNVHLTGYFTNTGDFDPTTGVVNLTATGLNRDFFILKLNSKNVYGSVFNDYNQNCNQAASEPGLSNRTVLIQPGNIVATTNHSGIWTIDSLPIGNYTIIVDTPHHWNPTCPLTQNFTVTNSNLITVAPSFGFVSTTACPAPEISICAPVLRRGFSNQKVYVRACNQNFGTASLDSAYALITLNPFLTVQGCSQNYISLGNNQYRINLGTIYPSECIDFWLDCTVGINSPNGNTVCMQADLYPKDTCALDKNYLYTVDIPCNTPYDNSHLTIQASCMGNDSISFNITNEGTGNMTCLSQVRLYIDGQLIKLDSVQLLSGQNITFDFSGDGRTWRMEVDQHPHHPSNSQPSETIELCGNPTNWTPNLVNIMPHNDIDADVDIFCGQVTGSFDPNDKTGFPLGVGANRNILPNQKLEYYIRFQNTGTDTAFHVVIRDTLSTDFNIFSVKSGVSSHDYVFQKYGSRVLEWTFQGIMLPDSNINEPASHGFVKFEVEQIPNLPNGTILQNKVGIYFDYNAPVITNTSVHTIDTGVIQNSIVQMFSDTACNILDINGFQYIQSGIYYQLIENGIIDSLYVFDLGIDTINSTITQDDTTLISNQQPNANTTYQWVDCDNGNTPISGATNQTFVPITNGNYAVQVTNGVCSSLSNCINYTIVEIQSISADWEVRIYPNPTQDLLYIQQQKATQYLHISLIDQLGQELQTLSSTNRQTTLDLHHLPVGIYFVVIHGEQHSLVEKIIKK